MPLLRVNGFAEISLSALTSNHFFLSVLPTKLKGFYQPWVTSQTRSFFRSKLLLKLSFFCEQGVVDAIGGAAASALQGPIQVTYREAFQNTILPSFERACHNMFQQINDSFHKGTQQCMLVLLVCLFVCLFSYVWLLFLNPSICF